MRFALITFDLKQNKIVFYIDKRQYFTHGVGKVLDISVLNRRTENCPELPGMPLNRNEKLKAHGVVNFSCKKKSIISPT